MKVLQKQTCIRSIACSGHVSSELKKEWIGNIISVGKEVIL